ncbi:MAG TPA: PstS family phosphate ABC transporter substrate-binding protein [Gaiellaceae bacterium]|nr:PstS family phosphate ABC transporter substrate-binding protein [Gaiellaceae bacterium]
MARTMSRASRSLALAACAGLAVCLLAASVAGAAPSVRNPTYNLRALSGTITADGSSTVGPYVQAAAELFARAGARNVRITVGISGTGGGFERFCRGETDIANASRPMRLREAQVCKDRDIGSWRAFTVANDALTVVVNPQNTWARCLSVEELKRIWEPGSKVSSWKDVRPGFPDVPLKLFGAGTDSGTFDYFTEAIVGRARASRTDYQASEDDNVLVQGVAGERGGLGYFGYSYYEENRSRLKAVQIRNPKTGRCVAPSVATVHNGSYKPLSRPLFVYVKGSSFRRREVQAFIDFIFDNEVRIAERADFVPLTKVQLRRARTTFHLAVAAASRGG